MSRDEMIRIAKRSENMLIKYWGLNSKFCGFVRGGSWKVENSGKSDDEGKLVKMGEGSTNRGFNQQIKQNGGLLSHF